MLRELVIFLCAGAYITAAHSVSQNAPAKSQASNVGAAEQRDHLALPSQVSYQNIAAPSSNYLRHGAPTFQVNPAVVETISEASTGKRDPLQSYGSSNVQQQTVTISSSVATDSSSSDYNNILERYAPAVDSINPYFASSVAAKTLSIESQAASNADQDVQVANNGYINRPYVLYNTAAQSGQFHAVPSVQTLVESQRFDNVPTPTQSTQYDAPAAVYSTSTARPFYQPNTAILRSHGQYTAQPTLASYQLNQAQTINHPQPPQNSAPQTTYNVKPVVQTVSVPVTKTVTTEVHSSVPTHPPPAPKYAPATIQVPVLFQQFETGIPAPQQFAFLTKTLVPTAPSYAQVPLGVEPIPVPVYHNNDARVQYYPIPVNGGYQNGYTKAVLYSPATEVSRVVFNGLGVSYGW